MINFNIFKEWSECRHVRRWSFKQKEKNNNEVIFLHNMHSVVNGYMRYISSQKVSYMLSYVVIVYLTDIC